MKREEVIEIAKEKGMTVVDDKFSLVNFLEAAFNEVERRTIERCAWACESLPMQQEIDVRDQCAEAIRALQQQEKQNAQ